MSDLSSLAARVAAATGPDRELDEAIGHWLWEQSFKPWECFDYGKDGPGRPFTSSIDAALALVEKLLPEQWYGILENAIYDDPMEWHIPEPTSLDKLPLKIIDALLDALRTQRK